MHIDGLGEIEGLAVIANSKLSKHRVKKLQQRANLAEAHQELQKARKNYKADQKFKAGIRAQQGAAKKAAKKALELIY